MIIYILPELLRSMKVCRLASRVSHTHHEKTCLTSIFIRHIAVHSCAIGNFNALGTTKTKKNN